MTNDDSWIRDCGPTFLINDKGERRAVDWEFNAWGGLVDGLYFPWDQDALVARKVCELTNTDSYKTEDFVLVPALLRTGNTLPLDQYGCMTGHELFFRLEEPGGG